MKRYVVILCFVLLAGKTKAQSQEIQQLLLNVEKLMQLKQILADMYKGYEVVSNGYNTIRDISKGNFSLHQLFLDGLMQVSPTVKKYRKVVDIISYQTSLVKEYKYAFSRFKGSNLFNIDEINYMDGVYSNLFNRSLQNLDELAMVVTAGKLRMSDEERIAAIDRIYTDMGDKLNFLRSFNRGNDVLAVQRGRESVDTKVSKKLNGL